jgi:hypothetical protein
MEKVEITITDKQYCVLKDMAKRENVSLADAVMKCVEFFDNHKLIISDKHKKILSMAGKYNSKLKDLSRNHDKYIDMDICEI